MYRLTRDRITAVSIAAIVFAALLVLLMLGDENIRLIAIPITIISSICVSMFIKKRSIHSFNKREVLLLVSVFAFLFITMYFLSGLVWGFVISAKGNITLLSLFTIILPIMIIITLTEIIREILLSQPTRVTTLFSYAIGVISDLVCAGGFVGIRSSSTLTDFLGMTLFPALTANLLFNYLSHRYGKMPPIIYRYLLTLYLYLIPVISDVPKALHSFGLILLPIIVHLFIDALFEKKVKKALKKQRKWQWLLFALAILLLLCFILMISCQFRFGIIVIATESMSGEIEMGDAVVFEQYEKYGEIKEGDIIVFEENNRRVVHRVVEINTVNGQREYITKGDANEGNDAGVRTDNNIIGIVRLKILYIGHPSLWLREIMSNK